MEHGPWRGRRKPLIRPDRPPEEKRGFRGRLRALADPVRLPLAGLPPVLGLVLSPSPPLTARLAVPPVRRRRITGRLKYKFLRLRALLA